MVVQNAASVAKSISGVTSKRWTSERAKSPAATLGVLSGCSNSWHRSPLISPSTESQPPMTTSPERAMMPSRTAGLQQSARRARMQSHGRLSWQTRSRATKRCGHRDTSAARPGDVGANITAGAASIIDSLLNCCVSALWPETSTVRVAHLHIRVAVLNGFTTVGTLVNKITG
jgi:hypothetical protein